MGSPPWERQCRRGGDCFTDDKIEARRGRVTATQADQPALRALQPCLPPGVSPGPPGVENCFLDAGKLPSPFSPYWLGPHPPPLPSPPGLRCSIRHPPPLLSAKGIQHGGGGAGCPGPARGAPPETPITACLFFFLRSRDAIWICWPRQADFGVQRC